MKPSSHGFFHAAPDRSRVQQVLEFYGVQDLGSRIPSA
jgi:allantoin racemase